MKRTPSNTKLTYKTAKIPGGYFAALFETRVDIPCERCGKTIPAGSLVRKRESALPIVITSKPGIEYDQKKYPNCRECSPFDLDEEV